MVSKDTVIELLEAGIVTLQFQKADGKPRRMRCTLNAKFLPEKAVETKKKKTKKTDIITVWDLEKKGWRSFRYSLLETLLEYPL